MYLELKELLKKNKITHKDIAKKLKIKSLGTISLKLNGKSIITMEEAISIKELLEGKTKKKYKLEELFRG